jgi:glyoxylase I family protein
MTRATLEHVNISVSDTARTAAMLQALFGWTIRWQGPAASGGHTIHIGNELDYLAIYAAPGGDGRPLGHAKGAPLNHIGVVVDDLDACEERAEALGMTPFNHGTYHPGRRFYLFDADGIEWEIVSYA